LDLKRKEPEASKSYLAVFWKGYRQFLLGSVSWLQVTERDKMLIRAAKQTARFFLIMLAILLSPVVATTLLIAFFLAL
jgi:hypothetical protein